MVLLITLLNIAIITGIALGILILKSPIFKSYANKYLAFAFFSFSISLLNFVLDDLTQTYDQIPFLRFINVIDSVFLFPVLIFLFIVYQVDHPVKNSKYKFLLFVPYIYALSTEIFEEFNLIESSFNNTMFESFFEVFNFVLQLFLILFFVPSILIYGYSCIKFSKNPKEKKWLKKLWYLIFVFTCSLISSFFILPIINTFWGYEIDKSVMILLSLVLTLFIYYTAYTGIFKLRLARNQEEIKSLINNYLRSKSSESIAEKDDKPLEPITKENQYFVKLEELCFKQQIFRDSTLDRNKVAEMLGISSGYVSQIVNNVTGDNFSTYISKYRVEAVKEIIVSPEFDNYSLLAIGLECGFSSKTTFHNTFKKITGMTPNAYRKGKKTSADMSNLKVLKP